MKKSFRSATDTSWTRRQFVCGAGAAVATLGAGVESAHGGAPAARAADAHLKLSLSAYSFHRYLRQSWPRPRDSKASMTLFDFVDFCAELNLDGTELTSYYFPPVVTAAYLNELKLRTFRRGLDISGTAIGNDFCVADGPEREFQFQMTRAWIDHAAALGAPVVRIFAGHVPKGGDESAALVRCVAGINQMVRYAAGRGVVLALENHGGITATATQLLQIVERIDDSPFFGINLDSGNFSTPDPYADLEKIAPLAVNVQMKVMMHPAGKERETANFGRVVRILKSTGYRGYVALEYEEAENPKEAIPRFIDELRAAIQ